MYVIKDAFFSILLLLLYISYILRTFSVCTFSVLIAIAIVVATIFPDLKMEPMNLHEPTVDELHHMVRLYNASSGRRMRYNNISRHEDIISRLNNVIAANINNVGGNEDDPIIRR